MAAAPVAPRSRANLKQRMPRAAARRPASRPKSSFDWTPAAPGEIYYLKQIDNSRVVRVADPEEKRQFLFWLLLGTVVFAAGLSCAGMRFAVIRNDYTIADLKGRRDTLLETNRKLVLEEASLRNPERIDSIARQQLGLAPPLEGQVVQMEAPLAPADGAVVVARLNLGVK